ncbi:MAG: DUF3887 domain-containing protein [Acidobacteria bacterium]|nr:DUF3887 domain-containing protein [Acidobacteriota bacterium]
MPILASLALTLAVAAGNPASRMHAGIENTARELVTNFAMGRLQQATKDFNDDMAATAPLDVMAEQKKLLEDVAGRFQTIVGSREYRQEAFRTVEVTCRYTKSQVLFRISFDETDRIGAVRFDPVTPAKLDPALEASSRAFLTEFTSGQYEQAAKRFDANLSRQLDAEKLADLGKTIATRFGTYRSITDIVPSADGIYRVVTMETKYDGAPVELRLHYNPDGSIAGMRIGPLIKNGQMATTTQAPASMTPPPMPPIPGLTPKP